MAGKGRLSGGVDRGIAGAAMGGGAADSKPYYTYVPQFRSNNLTGCLHHVGVDGSLSATKTQTLMLIVKNWSMVSGEYLFTTEQTFPQGSIYATSSTAFKYTEMFDTVRLNYTPSPASEEMQIVASCSEPGALATLVVNGSVEDTDNTGHVAIDLGANTPWGILCAANQGSVPNVQIAEVWWDDQFIDMNDASNRELFWNSTDGVARDPGADGSLINGIQPFIYFGSHQSLQDWNFGVYAGRGFNFEKLGADFTNL